MRKILVTSALPYANGDIHLGHLVEYIQADIWVRYQKLRGHECLFFCADDTHGTPIMLSAKQQNLTPEELIKKKQVEHLRDFTNFEIAFTHYSSTNSEINKKISYSIYQAMKDKSHISQKTIDQMYCTTCKMFLPDRFIKGKCPNCKSPDQYGDNCEKCGFTYSPNELIDPFCVICGGTPINKKSEHLFFELNHFKNFLKKWISEHVDKEVENKLLEWFDKDLKAWNISRDEPYFGFLIPGFQDKYFYVWVDAPVGYIASLEEWLQKTNQQKNYLDFWQNQKYEIYHFIGKDIIYFHSLFWPAMLESAGLSTPKKIFTHGFLTINGQKMSKSKKIFINAKDYLEFLSPLYLRYYFASKTSPALDDIDLNLEDFKNKINAELVGKITNLASRSMKLLNNYFSLELGELSLEGEKLREEILAKKNIVADLYEKRELGKVILQTREMAEKSNKYFDAQAPWVTAKKDPEATQKVLTDVLNCFRIIVIFLAPVLPSFSNKAAELFVEKDYQWEDLNTPLINKKINPYEHFITKINKETIDNLSP